jgi:transcriptional regulator with XRE-family HTH domain
MDIVELGRFLRVRREALQPGDVGFAPGGVRRTPGLRRDEVAVLAGISPDYYERLERGRAPHPSPELLTGLVRALGLSRDERDYLFRLAGHAAPEDDRGPDAGPEMLFLISQLEAVPAHVVDGLTRIVAQNALSIALIGDYTRARGRDRNLAWRWFTDPSVRGFAVPDDHEDIGRGWVAELRATLARRGHDPASRRLVDELLAASDEFAGYWTRMEVAALGMTRKVMLQPATGPLIVNCDQMLGSSGENRLIVLRPEPGTGTAELFARMRPERVAA